MSVTFIEMGVTTRFGVRKLRQEEAQVLFISWESRVSLTIMHKL